MSHFVVSIIIGVGLVHRVDVACWNGAVHVCEDNFEAIVCECSYFGLESFVNHFDCRGRESVLI